MYWPAAAVPVRCSGGTTFNFTVGEPFVTTIGANPKFTQGFQQPSTSGTPLPVHLLDFSGTAKNEYNLLTWDTAQEENNDYLMWSEARMALHFIA